MLPRRCRLRKHVFAVGPGRIAVLGVGSPLRGDDAAGVLAAGHLELLARRSGGRVRIFIGETAPENLTGEIKRFAPAHLVVIDAMDRKSRAGTLHVLDLAEQELSTLGPASTHNLPLGVLLKYLQGFLSCRITVLGIQPKTLGFGTPVSDVVQRAAKQAAEIIRRGVSRTR